MARTQIRAHIDLAKNDHVMHVEREKCCAIGQMGYPAGDVRACANHVLLFNGRQEEFGPLQIHRLTCWLQVQVLMSKGELESIVPFTLTVLTPEQAVVF